MKRILYSAYLPTNHLEDLQPLLDYAFVEPVNDDRYTDFYRGWSDNKLIIDNGLIEFGNAWGCDEIKRYRDKLAPKGEYLVTPPDKVGDWSFNLQSALEFSEPKHTLLCIGNFQWVGSQHESAKRLGFNYLAYPYRLPRYQNKDLVLVNPPHLFGFRKPEDYTQYPIGTTIDTVEPISAAFWYWEYELNGMASFPRPKEYASMQWGKRNIEMAKRNILWFKERYLNA